MFIWTAALKEHLSCQTAQQHTGLGRWKSGSPSIAGFAFFLQLILGLAQGIVEFDKLTKDDHFSVSGGPSLTLCAFWRWTDEYRQQPKWNELDGMITLWALFHMQHSYIVLSAMVHSAVVAFFFHLAEASFRETDLILHRGGPLFCLGDTFGKKTPDHCWFFPRFQKSLDNSYTINLLMFRVTSKTTADTPRVLISMVYGSTGVHAILSWALSVVFVISLCLTDFSLCDCPLR